MERIIANTMYRVKLLERGVELKRIVRREERMLAVGKKPPLGRGRITDFSFAARRRLRIALGTARPRLEGPYEMLGLCLSVPNSEGDLSDKSQELWAKEFARLFDLWRRRMAYSFPRIGWIWRVELTKKRMPHVHLVGFVPHAEIWDNIHEEGDGYSEQYLWGKFLEWCPDHDRMGPDAARGNYIFRWKLSDSGRGCWPSVVWEAREAWLELLAKCPAFEAGLPEAARVRAVDARLLTECVHYLCDHASKSKQEQLGWQGKQWGFINKPALVFVEAFPQDLSNHLATRLVKILERCFGGRRYHIPIPKPVLVAKTSEEFEAQQAKGIRERLSAIIYYNPRVCHRRGLRGDEIYQFDVKKLVEEVAAGRFEPEIVK